MDDIAFRLLQEAKLLILLTVQSLLSISLKSKDSLRFRKERFVVINCYEILGIRKNATASEIKRAYRQKAKLYHPDSSKKEDTEKFRLLVQAYEILSDARQRSIFDESFFNKFHFKKENYETFDYYKWLSERHDDESRAKLIIFDLMHGREDEAVSEYKSMCMNHAGFSLKHWFTREDFMDFEPSLMT